MNRLPPIRTLVLSVDIGAGHRMAAEALCQALAAERPGSTHQVVEALDYLGPLAGKLARELYFGLLEDAPGLWGAIYKEHGLFSAFRSLGELADDHRAEALRPVVREHRPDLVLAMHPIPCGLAAALARGHGVDCPVVAVVTDFDAHPAWIARGVDLYLTPADEIAAGLTARGLQGGAVAATGLPIRLGFEAIRQDSGARARLGLARDRFTILLLGGGLGLGPIGECAEALTSLEGPLQLVLIAGRNRELEAQARALAARSAVPLEVRGLVENPWEYLAAADLVVGKPGGATCAEVLAAGLPLIALAPIPGQEQANCDFLVRHGAARAAATAQVARTAVLGLLLSPALRESMRQAALRLGRPQAARAAARRVLALTKR